MRRGGGRFREGESLLYTSERVCVKKRKISY